MSDIEKSNNKPEDKKRGIPYQENGELPIFAQYGQENDDGQWKKDIYEDEKGRALTEENEKEENETTKDTVKNIIASPEKKEIKSNCKKEKCNVIKSKKKRKANTPKIKNRRNSINKKSIKKKSISPSPSSEKKLNEKKSPSKNSVDRNGNAKPSKPTSLSDKNENKNAKNEKNDNGPPKTRVAQKAYTSKKKDSNYSSEESPKKEEKNTFFKYYDKTDNIVQNFGKIMKLIKGKEVEEKYANSFLEDNKEENNILKKINNKMKQKMINKQRDSMKNMKKK